ncbi:MAG: Lrp/AsnC family transcriptional regulator [Pseudomonadota bacterium]
MRDNVDAIDRRILRELQIDASLSLDVLAERVALSRNACWRRIRKLEADGVILARVAHLDPQRLGLGLSVLVMIRAGQHDPAWLANFQNGVVTMPEVLGAHRMTGDLDYVLRVRVADMAGYDAFYKRLISKVPIADVSASFVMEDIKDTTALPI